ncbi:DUF4160 domain-containing protein [Microbulbifer halophilus]|uniref:DUF4160 domain-containing protein n=1 Tax=Microbulbifer halophilus TaxID=453963 RepID=A0ABW5EEV4_9GAMM|nr:DUF4160 domain-containing protein [Microbulbifer halophilus]MCW8125360.1 DUF4160 domain-containing protein [Microbulbifer halophilus]
MPKLYQYLEITLFFYSNEHEPIHVHAKHEGRESKAEIHFFHGKIKEIIIKDKGRGLDTKKRKEFEEFVNVYAEEIVEKWVAYFVRKQPIAPKVITQRVKNVRNFG